ncbi:response regulator transcription factor [Pedobacter insulae]|uniref:DNA-binding response regulator, NarL/FixJ family, contains REC and HTH domains n=1 Tax=Pedobacter insulae TaxID=414048 RepID=A0A1I2ZIZ4_9SPHI|nr:response regulator transcription factor [Pedobacter insulae]SFH37798.1 DNA-binding response regulator, NarL/FixJ family, contains REC and HTH domains [Pedobacter insulae]
MNLWNTIRIAYVEDQTGVRNSVCRFLNAQADTEVTYDTDSGKELLMHLQHVVPLPTICILDISMPEMDGLTLLKKIRNKWSKLPCLIYSMHQGELTIAKAIHLGANGYFSKRHSYEELYQAVKDIVSNGVAYSKDADSTMFEQVLNNEIEVPNLSDREMIFIKYAGSELSYSEIATAMQISDKTVETYRSRCFSKLNVASRVGLAIKGIELGIINI